MTAVVVLGGGRVAAGGISPTAGPCRARMWVRCPQCRGGGCVGGVDPQDDRDCPRCKGDGYVEWEQEQAA